jgi:hypothetical protein
LASPVFAWLALQQIIQHLLMPGRIRTFSTASEKPLKQRIGRGFPLAERVVPAGNVEEESSQDHEHLEIAQ